MATRKLQQSEVMMRAAESGDAAAQRAHDSAQGRRQQDLSRQEGARQFDESVRQQELNRASQQWDRQRQERFARDQLRAQNQANKPRTTNFGNEGYDRNAPPPVDIQQQRLAEDQRQFDITAQQRQQQMGEGARQFDVSTDLQAAQAGLQQNPRLEQLRAEMQMGQGIEHVGGDRNQRFIPTPEAQQSAQQSAETERIKAQTAAAHAVIRQQELGLRYQTLQAKLDGSPEGSANRAEFEAEMKKVRKGLVKPINDTVNLMSSLTQGKGSDEQWRDLQREVDAATEEGVQGRMLEIQNEISNRAFGPATQRFLAEKVSAKAVTYLAYTGEFPEGHQIDMSTEGMQQFVRNSRQAAQLLRGGINAELYPIQKHSQWVQMVNQLGAFLTLKARGGQGGGGDQQQQMPGGAMPDQGLPRHVMRRGLDDQGNPATPPIKQLNPAQFPQQGEPGYGAEGR